MATVILHIELKKNGRVSLNKRPKSVDVINISLLYIINDYIATIAVNNKEALLRRFSQLS